MTLLSDSGELLDQLTLSGDLYQNSIRHLALLGDQVAMQWEGDTAIAVPQLGHWTPGNPPRSARRPMATAPGGGDASVDFPVSRAGDMIGLTSRRRGGW